MAIDSDSTKPSCSMAGTRAVSEASRYSGVVCSPAVRSSERISKSMAFSLRATNTVSTHGLSHMLSPKSVIIRLGRIVRQGAGRKLSLRRRRTAPA